MLKFEIHNDNYNDYFVVTGDTIAEITQSVKAEMLKRGWKNDDCYSVRLDRGK